MLEWKFPICGWFFCKVPSFFEGTLDRSEGSFPEKSRPEIQGDSPPNLWRKLFWAVNCQLNWYLNACLVGHITTPSAILIVAIWKDAVIFGSEKGIIRKRQHAKHDHYKVVQALLFKTTSLDSARSICFFGGTTGKLPIWRPANLFRDAKREHVSWIPSCLQSCHEGTIHHSELMIETCCFMACCKAHNVGSTPQTKTWDATLFSVSGPQAAIVPSNPKPTRLRPKPRKYLGASGSSASWIWKTYFVKVGP